MAGNARAFFAERFFGDLDDDVLAGLQHFGYELRAARGTRAAALITAIIPWAAGTGAFESRSTADGTATAVGTSATGVGASTAIGATTTAVASPAAERPLEARTRVATDARGIAREIFAGSCWAADARRTSLAREENDVIFDGCCRAFGRGFTRGRSD